MSIPQAFQLAIEHHQSGRLREAEAIYRQILGAEPRHAESLHLLGVIASQTGRSNIAVGMIRQAIALLPDVPDFHANLGEAHRSLGHPDEAIAAYRRALELNPDMEDTWSNLGIALCDRGQFDESLRACRRALGLKPDFAQAHNNLGNALGATGRAEEALAAYRRALELKPDFTQAWNNLGGTLSSLGRFDEAVAAYRAALGIKADYAEACNNLGTALKDRGQLDEAMDCYERAIGLQPGDARMHSNLLYSQLFHPGHDARALREECARWERQHGGPVRDSIRPHSNDPEPGRRLKIGYVSPDFWRHVTCHFLTPLLEAHDHAAFEIYCYASVKRPDAVTARERRSVDAWRDVLGKCDEEVAEIIRRDGIDILVDLSQHMRDNRLPVFARKPAPVQVSWLGYPGTTGLSAIDYRLTDALMEPEGSPWSESVEKVIRLPDSWFCFDPIEEYPEPGELPARRAGHVTFGCLNNFCKVNAAVLERWAGVMRAVPGSRLLLQCPEGTARDRVRRFFAERGIDEARVELLAKTATRAEFLELFGRIDIALDPFPYNGGTTTCEALWMGIPVLTQPGEAALSRIGLSILTAVGLPEFVADSEANYVRLAASLAADLPRLAGYRATLRARMKASPFMDGPRFARHVEHAYREMWRTWCEKRSTLSKP